MHQVWVPCRPLLRCLFLRNCLGCAEHLSLLKSLTSAAHSMSETIRGDRHAINKPCVDSSDCHTADVRHSLEGQWAS